MQFMVAVRRAPLGAPEFPILAGRLTCVQPPPSFSRDRFGSLLKIRSYTMNKVLPDPPIDPTKDRAAFNRAIDHYLPTQFPRRQRRPELRRRPALHRQSAGQRFGDGAGLRGAAGETGAGEDSGSVAFAGNRQNHG